MKEPAAEKAPPEKTRSSEWIVVVLAWALVAIPLLWGVWSTMKKASLLFR